MASQITRPFTAPLRFGLGLLLAAAAATSPGAADGAPASGAPPPARPKRIYPATRLTGQPPVIDGRLDDACWMGPGDWAGDFRQYTPQHAGPPTQPTEVKILYDERHVYVAIRAHDGPLARRSLKGSARDVFAGDSVGVDFDSYHDQGTSFEFSLSSTGQKVDQRLTNLTDDLTWNAVWDGKVAQQPDCWTAEFKIPLSQLRYDPANTVWGLHVWRWIDQLREESHWSLLANDDSGYVKSFGELHGLRGLRRARHVELLPYAAVAIDNSPAGTESDYRAGVDAKICLTNDVTLDLSVLPDFGQVEVDPTVMNLTAFEIIQAERRPFFLEGRNLFDFAFKDDALFYSRRIGQPPSYLANQLVVFPPKATPLLGAAKVTGKTRSGASFGALASVTDEETVLVVGDDGQAQAALAPRAAQFVLRAQQDLRGGDSVIGGILTHVQREIPSDAVAALLPRQSTTGGLDLLHYWKAREYFLRAVAVGSSVRGDPRAVARLQRNPAHYFQRPPAGAATFDPAREDLTGGGLWLRAGKSSRGYWRWSEDLLVKSAGLEFNDLGYIARAGRREQTTTVAYVDRQPGKWHRNYRVELTQDNAWTVRDEFLGTGLDLAASAEFRNNWVASASLGARGAGRDAEALRGGPTLRTAAQFDWAGSVGTDAAKPFSLKLYANGLQAEDALATARRFGAKVSARPSSRLLLSVAFDATDETDRQRYLPVPSGDQPAWFVSQLTGRSRSLALRADWTIRPELSLQYYGNPFGANVRYADFRRVVAPEASAFAERFGPILPTTLADGVYALDADGDGIREHRFADPDGNDASFHSNLVLRWEYRPGSTMYLVWSQARTGAEADKSDDAWTSLAGLRRRAPTNQFIVKVSYWFST